MSSRAAQPRPILGERTCCRCGQAFMADRETVCPDCRRRPKTKAAMLGKALTPRQEQLADLVAQALPNKEIAYRLHLREGTVKEYMNRIFHQMGASNRTEVALSWVAQHPERYKTDVQQQQNAAQEAGPSHRDDGKEEPSAGSGGPGLHREAFRAAIRPPAAWEDFASDRAPCD